MVSDNVQKFRGANTDQISRDMDECILHLFLFSARLPLHQRGRAITQFPRYCHAAKLVITVFKLLNRKNRKESKP